MSSQDPYCYLGTSVLINKFDVRDQEQLNLREQMATDKAIRDLEKHPVKGNSVAYGDHAQMSELLDQDTKEFGRFRWDDNNRAQSAAHFTKLISNLWQAHAFREGNTRTIGVFMHQFAKERGFELDRETMWPAASET
ncbi:MAG: hypothetical protein E5W59_29255, partial [Mesorhizobium sp.]